MYLQQDDNYQKFNNGSIQDKFYSSFKKLEDKHICSCNICGTYGLQELCSRLRSFVIYIFILHNSIRYHKIKL